MNNSNNNIKHTTLINSIKDSASQELFEKLFENLTNEFSQYNFYENAEEYIFELNERAYLGFITNALIRKDTKGKYITIQEYTVYNKKKKYVGRADLFLKDRTNNYSYLFEAKWDHRTDRNWNYWDIKETKKTLTSYKLQGEKYYYAEEEYFKKQRNSFIITIIFETIKYWKGQDQYLNNFNEKTNSFKKDIENFFMIHYYFEKFQKKGLTIYGQINEYPKSK